MQAVTDDLSQLIGGLLKKVSISADCLEIERIDLGGNNQSYRVTSGNQVFFVKHYFTHHADTRDRLTSEYLFSEYAAFCAPGLSAKPFAKDDAHKIAVYEFLAGKPFSPNMLTQCDVGLAAEFFCRLNDPKNRAMATHFPKASEACFSAQDHLRLISHRLLQLKNIPVTSDEDASALILINQIDELWQEIKADIKIMQDVLTPDQYCLSPSDFGFHNALKMPDGSLRFIDFEYAGWDDPAKMIGDFFAQIAVPVPDTFFDFFAEKTLKHFPRGGALMERARQKPHHTA